MLATSFKRQLQFYLRADGESAVSGKQNAGPADVLGLSRNPFSFGDSAVAQREGESKTLGALPQLGHA